MRSSDRTTAWTRARTAAAQPQLARSRAPCGDSRERHFSEHTDDQGQDCRPKRGPWCSPEVGCRDEGLTDAEAAKAHLIPAQHVLRLVRVCSRARAKPTARWPGFNSFLSQLLTQIEKHFQALSVHECRLQCTRSLECSQVFYKPQHLLSASIKHAVLVPSASGRRSGHDLRFQVERCSRRQQASAAALLCSRLSGTRYFCSQLVSTCHRVW